MARSTTIPQDETVSVAVLAREYRLTEKQVRYRLGVAGTQKVGKGRWPLWACIRALNAAETRDDLDFDLTPGDQRDLDASLRADLAHDSDGEVFR